MTAIKKHAIELIMNLPDEEIRAILEKYELTKPDSTAKIDESGSSLRHWRNKHDTPGL